MQTPANHMDVTNTNSQSKRMRIFIPVVLIVVVMASLFSLNSSSDQPGENIKQISALDAAGASYPGSGGCWSTQAQVDAAQAAYDADPNNIFLWLNLQNLNYNMCPDSPKNPSISVGDNCEKPAITVAILVYRSTSVI